MQNKGFDYYAFISYNHKDAKWARRLQHQLEHYRLPSALCKEQPELPRRITPVFLDSSDLVARSSLLESLRTKLDASNYLIVLCSPNSAASPWVNDEVEYFISTGRKDQIIPLIIDGEPHAADPAKECYPPALSSLSSHEELLGIDVQAHGRRGAFLRIIATLLDLRLDRVISRDAAVRHRRFVIYACAAFLLVAMAFSLIWYNTPHTAYYMDYTYVWEEPVGIQEVSSSRRRQMDYTYRFTTLRGDVVRVERVNSAGILVSSIISLAWEDPPSMRFYYGTSDDFDGRVVTRVAYFDIYGQKLYEKHYSADLRAVDFVQSGNGGASFSLGASLLSSQAAVGQADMAVAFENRSDVIRYLQTYNDNGCLIRRMFKRDNRGSSGGTPTRDENGVWGVSYIRDDLGRVVGTRYLDQDGAFMSDQTGSAGTDYTYGDSGRVNSQVYLDLSGSPFANGNGFARTVMEYDEFGRMVELVHFDADGERVIDSSAGVSIARLCYDDRGFWVSQEWYDHMQEPCCAASGLFRVESVNDDNGRPIRRDFYGPDGELQPSTDGVASVVQTYAPDGQVDKERYYGVDGEPVPMLSLNVYGMDFTYTDGLLTRVDFVDGQGCPMRSKEGAASICREYNSERQVSREQGFDEGGALVRSVYGCAETRLRYTDGNCTRVDYYDETGVRCNIMKGMASYVNTYEAGQLTTQSCFGPAGEPVLNDSGWHSVSRTFDEEGLLLRECYYGTEGERVTADEGYSAVSYTYDNAGRTTSATYYNTQDQECTLIKNDYYGASRLQWEYDQRGNLIRRVFVPKPGVWDQFQLTAVSYTYDSYRHVILEEWQDDQGAPVLNRHGYASGEVDYDMFGRVVDCRWYDETGAPSVRFNYIYDRQGRNTQTAFYDERDGTLMMRENSVYDEFGNCVEQSCMNGNGQPCIGPSGYALARSNYDAFGNVTDTRIYDESGNGLHKTYTYSVTGKALTEASYDADEQLVQRTERTYDSYDRLIEERFYGADGSCTGWAVYTYSPRGELIESSYYNGNGSLADTECFGVYITEVREGTPAAEAGLQVGDIFIVNNLWSFRSTLADLDASITQFMAELESWFELEKHFVVGRYNEDGTDLAFIEVTLPAKQGVGIAVKMVEMYSSDVKEILRLYNEWLEQHAQLGSSDSGSNG